MRKLLVIGIGTGNPEHMTVQAINALNRADIVLVPRKGEEKEDLAELRREICRRYLTNERTRLVEFDLPVRDEAEPSYGKRVADWHQAIAATYRDLIAEHTGEDGTVAFLVWGDPSLYDSTLRILDRLGDVAGFAFAREVIPGITSIQALAASHGIALNTVGGAVQLTTGRNLSAGFPENADTAVVLLDGKTAFRALPGDDFTIYWGAYLGAEDEITVSGKLGDVADAIADKREAARRAKGWIMDTYLLRRRSGR
ncbi:precorrin-6A synthase (deacetylating) [Nitratireductor sp. GCM10026969]|uniref:precorrin-6A synthase (deacetylating) n=1 Tax=Nitratireductor sp. GCM10026969 TaxID=3252645 RepID=UPI003613A0E8